MNNKIDVLYGDSKYILSYLKHCVRYNRENDIRLLLNIYRPSRTLSLIKYKLYTYCRKYKHKNISNMIEESEESDIDGSYHEFGYSEEDKSEEDKSEEDKSDECDCEESEESEENEEESDECDCEESDEESEEESEESEEESEESEHENIHESEEDKKYDSDDEHTCKYCDKKCNNDYQRKNDKHMKKCDENDDVNEHKYKNDVYIEDCGDGSEEKEEENVEKKKKREQKTNEYIDHAFIELCKTNNISKLLLYKIIDNKSLELGFTEAYKNNCVDVYRYLLLTNRISSTKIYEALIHSCKNNNNEILISTLDYNNKNPVSKTFDIYDNYHKYILNALYPYSLYSLYSL